MSESQNIEYKESWRDEYLKWICGFANAQGGCIYIGINDAGAVTGVQNIKKLMEEQPSLNFEVQGHCDNTGSAATNDRLSQQRAEAIVLKLVELGVDRSRLSAVGKGSNEPIADNSTNEGRARNRRVEFVKK